MPNIVNGLGQVKVGVRIASGGGGGIDTDAQAFITAANITDTTQQNAINTLVTQLKTYGIWTKMKALYPFVGGNASAHKFNLKDPRDLDVAYRLAFSGGWTHSSTGAKPNGTTGFANTYFNPSTNLSINNAHMSYYSRTNNAINGYDMGVTTVGVGSFVAAFKWLDDGVTYWMMGSSPESGVTLPSTARNFLFNKISSVSTSLFANDTKYTASVTNTNLPNNYFYLGTRNINGIGVGTYTNRESSFASIGDGLTDTEAANFYTAVQTFQTTLGRHVGVPIVADSDAQAFLNAAVITDSTQASAINTLVTDLKTANIWTKMKALYPFVGGTATAHKLNLKDPRDLDAAYRLVFNGGMTHSSTGCSGNSSNAWANTYLNAQSVLINSSMHLSFYTRTNNTFQQYSNEILSDGSYSSSNFLALRTNNKVNNFNAYFSAGNDVNAPVFVSNIMSGFIIGSKTSTSLRKFYRNGNILGTNTVNDTNLLPNSNISLFGSSIAANNYSGNESAFASIGDGLTDAEAAAFYTAVQKYQTTLGRQV